MNENIKKLIEQTDIYCDQHWLGNPFYEVKWEEKFAELLIKDCADCLDDGDMEGLWVRNVLYNRFGVEQ